MEHLLRRVSGHFADQPSSPHSDPDRLGVDHPRVSREWLVTNGLGGYASGPVSGFITRRFHGLLVAALPAPQGRTMMLNHVAEKLHLPGGETASLSSYERADGSIVPAPTIHLVEFRLEGGLPVWRFQVGKLTLEKSLCLSHGQNTVLIAYKAIGLPGPMRLDLQPYVNFRPHEGPLNTPIDEPYPFVVQGDRYELGGGGSRPPLRMQVHGAAPSFAITGDRLTDVRYDVEESRGYDSHGDLYSPGYFTVELRPDATVTLLASTEEWETASALSPEDAFATERMRRAKLLTRAHAAARSGVGGELVLAADQFVITPTGRVADAARARAAGDEIRTVIAGYHWFTDWGRDTMISLEGLTLLTGRFDEAAYVLRTFGHYVRDGLIPNLFPEGKNAGLYHTADATLWYFHAIDRYLELTGDRALLRHLLPTLQSVVDHHLAGTRFGIAVDPSDGLLRQGADGYALTWMDAKVGDLVVTPRRGKAVEINALFYNALMLLAGWLRELRGEGAAATAATAAARARDSFQRRFWYEEGQYLYDVVDGERGDDSALRPNQLFAISLRHPILDASRWERVVTVVEQALLTPVGLRTLASSHPDYKAKYFGDLRARDLAYHQGTVWPWLIGPFVDAWIKVHPGQEHEAQRFLTGLIAHLSEGCIGSISEIFDAEAPFLPRGCIAQAWSIAEALRCWVKSAA